MYKIVIKLDQEEKELLANSYEELRAVITLCPEANYEIILVESLNCDLASEFSDKLIIKIKEIYPQSNNSNKEDPLEAWNNRKENR